MRTDCAQVLALRPNSQLSTVQTSSWSVASRETLREVRQELQQVEHVPDELILGVEDGTLLSQTLGPLHGEQFAFEGQKEILRLRLAPGTDLATALASAREIPGVAYAEPNQVIRLDSPDSESVSGVALGQGNVPNDLSGELWALHNPENPAADIDALQAWDITTGTREGALIAVLDSGADYNHPDLKANIVRNENEIPGDGIDNDGNGVIDDIFGYNAFEGHGDPMDGMGHGTHCTGTIAAVGNNGKGVVGVNWKAKVLPVKIFHDRGLTTTDAILRGIAYANSRGAAVTSNSWGGPAFSQAIHDAFQSSPALHIAAAGNDSHNTDEKPSYPANYELPNMISVGASSPSDEASWFSNVGRETVDLFAPGEKILSTVPGGELGEKSGTSMATPHVSGVAGLVLAEHPTAGTQELKDRLLFSTDSVSNFSELSVTGGRLNAARALGHDATPPAAPNDFVVTEIHPRGARFSWTAPGDDGWKNGAATAFEVKVSRQPINSENWDQASQLTTPRGREIGDHLHAHFQQAPRSRETSVYAAFHAVDEVGNRSELLTSKAVMPASPVFFQDDMNSEQTQWQANSRWTRVDLPGRGKVWTTLQGKREGETFSVLQSPMIDLAESKDSFLRFESKQEFAWSNNVFVEISDDRGENWSRLGQLDDRNQWAEREFDLGDFDGARVQVRIRAENLGAKPGDGMSVDNFEVLGNR